MNRVANRNEYKARIIDSVVEEYLQISGALCIEGPKW